MKQALTKNAVLIKVGLYVALTLCAGLAGRRFYHHYAQLMDSSVVEDATDRVGGRIASQTRFSQIVIFGGAFFVSVVGLGLMVGHDVSHLVAERFGRVMYNDEGEALKKTGYEEAERTLGQRQRPGRDPEDAGLPQSQPSRAACRDPHRRDLREGPAESAGRRPGVRGTAEAEAGSRSNGPGRPSTCATCTTGNSANRIRPTCSCGRIVDEYGETSAAEKARKRLGIDNEEEDAAAPPPTAEPARPKPPVRVINEGLQAHLKKLHGSGQNET